MDSVTATPMKIRIGRYSRSKLSIDDAPKRARWWPAKGEADTVTQMAGVTGLEPATSGVTGRRSNQLSYTPAAPTPRRPLLPLWPRRCQAREAGFSQVFPGLSASFGSAVSHRNIASADPKFHRGITP